MRLFLSRNGGEETNERNLRGNRALGPFRLLRNGGRNKANVSEKASASRQFYEKKACILSFGAISGGRQSMPGRIRKLGCGQVGFRMRLTTRSSGSRPQRGVWLGDEEKSTKNVEKEGDSWGGDGGHICRSALFAGSGCAAGSCAEAGSRASCCSSHDDQTSRSTDAGDQSTSTSDTRARIITYVNLVVLPVHSQGLRGEPCARFDQGRVFAFLTRHRAEDLDFYGGGVSAVRSRVD